MNEITFNNYGFDSDNVYKSLVVETRDWRLHEHKHLTSAQTEIDERIDAARAELDNRIDGARSELDTRIDNARNTLNNSISTVTNNVQTVSSKIGTTNDAEGTNTLFAWMKRLYNKSF